MIGWASVKAFFATRKLWTVVGGLVLAAGLVTGCYLAITQAYTSVYQAGYRAGADKTELAYKNQIITAQAKQLELQQALAARSKQFNALYDRFDALQSQSPTEIIKYVRQDPAFAASRRPSDAHALRVRELQLLREAAATH